MDSIGKNLGILCRQLHIYLKHALRETDVTPTELMFLGFLRNGDGRSQEEIARDFCIDKAAVARTLQSLESKKLVVRGSDAADKRNKLVYTTSRASQYNGQLSKIQTKWITTAFNGVDDSDIAVFAKVLETVVNNIR